MRVARRILSNSLSLSTLTVLIGATLLSLMIRLVNRCPESEIDTMYREATYALSYASQNCTCVVKSLEALRRVSRPNPVL